MSGVLIGADRALTASHLVPDEGARLLLPDGGKTEAKIVGRDSMNDLALLRLDSGGQFARPAVASVGVGDLVLALRRDPFDGINAAFAMVSAAGVKLRLGRGGVIERYLQTDAERMQGSTGGPLVDTEGALAGIQVFNRRMAAEVAIPAELALERAKLLEEKGNVQRPYLGIRSQGVTLSRTARDAVQARQDSGLLLIWIEQGSAAERAGMEVGDILVGFGGVRVTDHEKLLAQLMERGAGATVDTELVRGGVLRSVSIVIGGA
ncbi:MAG: trypsin-like peptidase domain-containing protein [Spirochaetia bacterium]